MKAEKLKMEGEALKHQDTREKTTNKIRESAFSLRSWSSSQARWSIFLWSSTVVVSKYII